MLFKETTDVYYDNKAEPTLCGKDAEFPKFNAGGIHNYNSALKLETAKQTMLLSSG
jgi:hypothetical protein